MANILTKTKSGGDKKFAEFTFERWRGLAPTYERHIDRWRRTLDFIRSEHWNSLQHFGEQDLPSWREFPIINFTLAFYGDYMTEFLQSEVRYSAVPASPEPSDIASAELGEQVLSYLWDKTNMERKRVDLAAWQMATGTGVLRVFWDTDTGEMVPLGVPTPQGIMPVDPDTMQPDPSMQEPEMVDKGEIGVEVISPQFVRWPQSQSEGVMVGLLLSYDEAEAMYGKEAAENLSYQDGHEALSTDLVSLGEHGGTGFASEDKRALVIEHYIPPSSKHPDGLWWTAADGGNEILTGPWPLPAGVVPIVPFRWVPIPGDRNVGMSPLHEITFSNKVYDRILGKVLEWQKKVVPKILLKQGGGVTKGDITNEPFQELIVTPQGEPEPMEVDQVPATFYETMNGAKEDAALLSGQQFEEQDQRKTRSAVSSVEVPDRQEGGKTALAHLTSKSSWQRLGKVLLHYVAEFYNEERVIGIQGPDKRYQWVEFSGKDLGNLEATIQVDEIPLIPNKRKNLRDTVIGLLNSQAGQILFADEQGNIDQDRVEQAIQAAGIDENIETLDPDVREARNEHVEFRNLKQGQQPPQVQGYQNHAAHHEEHTTVMKSLKFKSWPPQARQAFQQHVQQHEQILNQQAQQERDAMIEQEKQLREVREQAELKGDILKEYAQEIIGMVVNQTELSLEELTQSVEGMTEDGESATQTQQGE